LRELLLVAITFVVIPLTKLLLVGVALKELLLVATMFATLKEFVACCNNTKKVVCCKIAATMTLSETHFHLHSNCQGIDDISFLFVDFVAMPRKDASEVGFLASGGSTCPNHWRRGGCSLVVCPQN
jgi:hypothetical protein